MSKAVLFKEETGETWSLESYFDCVKGFYLAPGAKKPKLTRVPLKLCSEGDPDKHVTAWMETLKGQGYGLKEEDKAPADPEVTIRWSAEGLVEVDWLPADLQKIADVQSGIIHIPVLSDTPITFFEKSQFGDGSGKRRPFLAGTITYLADLVVLLRLADALKEHGVEVCGMLDEESQDAVAQVVTMTPEDGADKAASLWPELRTHLEEHDLLKVPVHRLVSSTSHKWFF